MMHRVISMAIRGGLCLATGMGAAMGQQRDQPDLVPLPFPDIDAPHIPEPGLPLWLLVGCGLILAALVALLVYLLVRKAPAQAMPPPLQPLKRALYRLETLRAALDEFTPSAAAHEVSVILRDYQESRYHVPAPYLTTEELYEDQTYASKADLRDRFSPLAQFYDRLSFGRIPATRDEAKSLIDLALTALGEERIYLHGDSPASLPDSVVKDSEKEALPAVSENSKADA